MSPAVAVTGIGLVSALGSSPDEFWSRLVAGSDGTVAGSVPNFDPSIWLGRREIRRSSRFMQFAVAAAVRAAQDAGLSATNNLEPDPLSAERTAVVLANVYGAPEMLAAADSAFAAEGSSAVNPLLGMIACESAAASAVALKLGVRGPTKVVVGACAGGAMAIADGADLIQLGRADLVIAGASQAMVTPTIEAAYQNLRVLSPTARLRPFHGARDGFVFSEGAAVLVLERLSHAVERGANIYGLLAGSANTNDAANMISPSGDGAVRCMRLALADAELDPKEIVHVNAHGTGTEVNDLVEAHAIADVFGTDNCSVTSIKAVTGHTASASGAFEAAAVLLSFRHRRLPPAILDSDVDHRINVEVITGSGPRWNPGPTISNSFGLGGHNTSLLFTPHTP